jgi:hypothetical protein
MHTSVSEAEAESNYLLTPPTIEILNPRDELKASTWVSHFLSSEDVNRVFCGKCGTSLTYFYSGVNPKHPSEEPEFDIALGSLDDECLGMPGLKPTRQAHVEDGVEWVRNLVKDGENVFSG